MDSLPRKRRFVVSKNKKAFLKLSESLFYAYFLNWIIITGNFFISIKENKLGKKSVFIRDFTK
jgi:hypothetical protein